eukprot:gene11412-13937_t
MDANFNIDRLGGSTATDASERLQLLRERIQTGILDYCAQRTAETVKESGKVLLQLVTHHFKGTPDARMMEDTEHGRMLVDAIRSVFEMGPENAMLEQILETNFSISSFNEAMMLSHQRLTAECARIRTSTQEAPQRPRRDEFEARARLEFKDQVNESRALIRQLEEQLRILKDVE